MPSKSLLVIFMLTEFEERLYLCLHCCFYGDILKRLLEDSLPNRHCDEKQSKLCFFSVHTRTQFGNERMLIIEFRCFIWGV